MALVVQGSFMFRRTLLITATSVVSALALTACGKDFTLDKNVQNAPQAAGKLLSGSLFSVADNKDQITVVQFWATWCPVCVKEMPTVQKWYEDNKSKGLNLASVSLDDKKSQLTDWLQKNPSYTQPYAWQGDVSHNLGPIKGTPTFIVIGKGGTVVKSLRGGITEADLADIAKLL
jgi:thiol-disulfide isomerase/thioredoxin